MGNANEKKRFWEIDFLRGLGIFLVVIFHFFFDLNFFHILPNSMYSGWWLILQRFAASLLILLVGISVILSYEKTKKERKNYFIKNLKRSGFLFAVALVITLATWIYPHNGFIIFGIIHFIAFSVFLSYFFLRFFYLNLVLGIAAIFAGLQINKIVAPDNLLMWVGLYSRDLHTLDYFPLLPWFGIVLIGMFMGKYFYSKTNDIHISSLSCAIRCGYGLSSASRGSAELHKLCSSALKPPLSSGPVELRSMGAGNFVSLRGGRMNKSSSAPKFWLVGFFTYLGRKSLQIYLAHQPILIGLLIGYLILL
ncbi:DUF1624 domain-containing protein [Candidatus Micrarchaeota archaeon]|nr:DUF1624 domain-containing protein [Candidatus Micrarchaeota archaeon]MBU1166480.1 DUF1624 domain-containing protein [Candidatus Micrarchaeota archaeon]MBU1886186.1 DUF1624 domain-containing protein [Candidatus Micrarchaeota archaeon]